MEEKQLTEKESLAIITDMVNKVKNHYHENGTYLILWGTVITICGLVSAAERFWSFSIGFDIWILTLIAVVPQIWLIIRERKRKKVITHTESAIDTIWIVYMITIVCIILYGNIIYFTSPGLLKASGIELFSKNIATGETKPFRLFAPSFSSIFLMIYAFPTLATGMITKYRPMIIGAILTYGFFVLSLFTDFAVDMLLSSLGAISCWLIPGLMLRSRYLRQPNPENV